jgi:hypothetical protein
MERNQEIRVSVWGSSLVPKKPEKICVKIKRDTGPVVKKIKKFTCATEITDREYIEILRKNKKRKGGWGEEIRKSESLSGGAHSGTVPKKPKNKQKN